VGAAAAGHAGACHDKKTEKPKAHREGEGIAATR
jgi:hypothetical protein